MEGLNVNSDGLKIEDSDFLKIVKQHDLIALAETHIGEEDKIEIEGFSCMKICRPVNKQINRHFGGLAILYRSELKPGLKFIEHRNNDYIWLKMCMTFFGLDEDLYVCVAYIPPENSSYYKVRNQDTLSYIENDLRKYSVLGKTLLFWDLNARTGMQPDFISDDGDLEFEEFSYISDQEILPRRSTDTGTVCTRGRKLLDLCISARLRILNGRCIGDSQSQYTCHKYGGSSVVDYLLSCEENLKRIVYFKVLPFAGQLSDHCCISWAMKCCITKQAAGFKSYPKQNKPGLVHMGSK